jgi:hypothetical protein
MIEEILQNQVPYLLNGKKLYEEEDVKKMLVELLQKLQPVHKDKAPEREYYPGATC